MRRLALVVLDSPVSTEVVCFHFNAFHLDQNRVGMCKSQVGAFDSRVLQVQKHCDCLQMICGQLITCRDGWFLGLSFHSQCSSVCT